MMRKKKQKVIWAECLDTSNVEPMSHIFPVNNVFREDVVVNGDDRENILANAPEERGGAFVVPKTVE